MTRARVGWINFDSCRPSQRSPARRRRGRSRSTLVARSASTLASGSPLIGAPAGDRAATQWAWVGQPIEDDAPLFLAQELGRDRMRVGFGTFDTPITTRKRLKEGSEELRTPRSFSQSFEEPHPLDGFMLEKLGALSCKHTGMTLMKDVCSPTPLVGAVAGRTSVKTLAAQLRSHHTPATQHGAAGIRDHRNQATSQFRGGSNICPSLCCV